MNIIKTLLNVKTENLRAVVPAVAFIWMLLSANKTPLAYTQYEMKARFIVATEGFTKTWKTEPSGKSSVIGCGYNDWGSKKRRDAIQRFVSDGLTIQEGVEISMDELSKFKVGKTSDPLQELAFRFHAFNTGHCKDYNDMLGCCGNAVGCGSPNRDVRKSHSERREFEKALYCHNYERINAMMDDFTKRSVIIRRRHKG